MTRAEQQSDLINAVAVALGGAMVRAAAVIFALARSEVIRAIDIAGDISDHDEAAALDAINAAGVLPSATDVDPVSGVMATATFFTLS